MSREELSRLVQDTISNQDLIQEAMTIKSKQGMEAFVKAKGYSLTSDEVMEIWELTAKVLSGRAEPMSAARWRIDTVRDAVLVTNE